jgi:Cu/Ag efflux pump CusA
VYCSRCIRSSVHLCCPGSSDSDFEPGHDPSHAWGHLSKHQHSVIAIAWTHSGLNPEEVEGRITSVYERVLTTTVDDIEHIESTTLNGLAVVKLFFQPGAGLDTANAQVTAVSRSILRH